MLISNRKTVRKCVNVYLLIHKSIKYCHYAIVSILRIYPFYLQHTLFKYLIAKAFYNDVVTMMFKIIVFIQRGAFHQNTRLWNLDVG